MDRLQRDETKSRGIKIKIPPNGIRQKVSIKREGNGRAREREEKEKKRERGHDDRTMRIAEENKRREKKTRGWEKEARQERRLVIRI